ncbi:Abi family protein [Grimontia hollisae]|uniref:Abi family protein n=1 Tax=Grimontia hollisae TaxID=673 RepID=UPI0012AC7254|nr:Abi family protein [Grimontia hollisae]MDF2185672.1 Abi family protein [Grimontia hollisae]
MKKYISVERLDIYSKHLKVKDSEIIAAYQWNKDLAGALLPALHCLEVTLRNAISCAIQENPPPAAKGLYSTGSDWIFSFSEYMGKKLIPRHQRFTKKARQSQKVDAQGYVLDKFNKRLVVKRSWEEDKVISASQKVKREGKTVTTDRVISALDFGFWTNFLTEKYEDNNAKSLLWPNQMSQVFPNAPPGTTRETVEKTLNRIRDLRNRLTHHEAIWKFFYDDPKTGKPNYSQPVYGVQASCSLLSKHYEDILTVVGWIDQESLDSFLSNQGDARFRSLCCVDGLHSYISPDKLDTTFAIGRGGWGIRKIMRLISRGEMIRITRSGATLYTIGRDTNRLF